MRLVRDRIICITISATLRRRQDTGTVAVAAFWLPTEALLVEILASIVSTLVSDRLHEGM